MYMYMYVCMCIYIYIYQNPCFLSYQRCSPACRFAVSFRSRSSSSGLPVVITLSAKEDPEEAGDGKLTILEWFIAIKLVIFHGNMMGIYPVVMTKSLL